VVDGADRPAVGTVYHWSNQLAYTAGLTYRALGIPYTFSPLGILHDRFLVDDRDRPYERPPDWSRLIWRLADLPRRALRSRSPRRALRNYLTHHPLLNADLVVALSKAGERLYHELGIPPERTRVVPLGIDLGFAEVPDGDAWRARWPRPVVMYIGQLKYRKGWDLLLRAIPRVLARHPTASFVFNTHSPVARSDFERLVEELGVGGHVHLLQRISEEEKARLYRAADVMCLPTRYESFGIPIAEAMAAGCPVVSTRLPVIDEMIADGHDGVLVPYDDAAALGEALADLLADEPRRRRLAANGRQSALRFDIDAVCARLLDEYRALIARRAGRGRGGA
jgi:glycosyltransferase involved in cell wall biosynthesis